jgi:hypothetical protein
MEMEEIELCGSEPELEAPDSERLESMHALWWVVVPRFLASNEIKG